MHCVGSFLGKTETRAEEEGYHCMLKCPSIKKFPVTTQRKQILFGWKLLGQEMTQTAQKDSVEDLLQTLSFIQT